MTAKRKHDSRVPVSSASEPEFLSAPEPTFFGEPFRDFEHVGGVHVTGTVLWCDSNRKNGLNFLSSARAGEVGRNRRLLCTEPTLRIATRGKARVEALTAPYDKPIRVGDLSLSLHPAGHMLGAAQLRIQREARVLVYAGDVSRTGTETTLGAESVPCDALALPATFARRPYRFPDRADVLAALRDFIDGTQAARRTPVLLAQPVELAQDLMVALGRAGYRLRVHRSVAEVSKLYATLGVVVPPYKRYTQRLGRGEVGVFPAILKAQLEGQISDARFALVGPRAVDAAYVYQSGVAAAFGLSDVADRVDLLDFVDSTGARSIYLTGGYIDDFAADLRDRGLRVYGLRPSEQLELFA